MAIGPDGNIWFTENLGNRIGRISPDGATITEFAIPTDDSQPRGIKAGPDGNLWFAELNANQIGRITPSGQITIIPTSSSAKESARHRSRPRRKHVVC